MALIGKVEAAERLILSGILMFERGEDPFAVHVIASSALNMLREMIGLEGDPYQVRLFKEGLFMAATARAEGNETPLAELPGMDDLIGMLVPAIQTGAVKAASQIELGLTKAQIAKMLDAVYRPYNFLKHSDRDPLATLDEADVDPAAALQHALLAFGWIVPNKEWPDAILPFLEKQKVA